MEPLQRSLLTVDAALERRRQELVGFHLSDSDMEAANLKFARVKAHVIQRVTEQMGISPAELEMGSSMDPEQGMDMELLARVVAVAQRVLAYRNQMPEKLQQRLAEDVRQLRPPECAQPVELEHAQADKENLNSLLQLSPATTELFKTLEDAVSKGPGIRAKLAECLDRMERVTEAVSSSQLCTTPSSVQRALDSTPGHVGKLQTAQAKCSATPKNVNTQKRVLQDVQSVPYQL